MPKISSKQKFENCKIEGSVLGDHSQLIDKSQHHTHISGNYCNYEGRTEDSNPSAYIITYILKKLSSFLISHFGELKSKLLGVFIIILGLFGAINTIISTYNAGFSTTSSSEFNLWFIQMGIIYLLVCTGFVILLSISTNNHTKCEKCGQSFAYKERKRPLVEEKNCSDGIRQKTTRYYKCQYCGHEREMPYNRLIKYEYLIK
jgi:DNA-directed RNA polymerase subunit RPC12/RpoP